MSGIARINDTVSGICSSHSSPRSVTGKITTGSIKICCENLSVARVGDLVSFDCGHKGIINSGSDKIFCENIPVAREGDTVVGYEGSNIQAKKISSSSKVSSS